MSSFDIVSEVLRRHGVGEDEIYGGRGPDGNPDGRPYGSLVNYAAKETGLDPELIHAVIKVESGYDPAAVSPKGAMGLMQLMPDTARELGVKNAHDPAENILAGARYLSKLIEANGGSVEKGLWAYNAGQKRVQQGILPAETEQYIARVKGIAGGEDPLAQESYDARRGMVPAEEVVRRVLLQRLQPKPTTPEVISAAPPDTLLDKLKGFFQDQEEMKAQAGAIDALAAVSGRGRAEIEADPALREKLTSEIFGARDVKDSDYYNFLMNAAVAGGILPIPAAAGGIRSHIWPTLKAIAGFTGLGEAESALISAATGQPYEFLNQRGLSELLPEGAGKNVVALTEAIDFVAKGAALGFAGRKLGARWDKMSEPFKEKYLRERMESVAPGATIEIPAQRLRDYFTRGSKAHDAEFYNMMQDIGIPEGQARNAVLNGLTIELPATKLVKVADKPWWGQLKRALDIDPYARVTAEHMGPARARVSEVRGKRLAEPEPQVIHPLRDEVFPEAPLAPERERRWTHQPLESMRQSLEERSRVDRGFTMADAPFTLKGEPYSKDFILKQRARLSPEHQAKLDELMRRRRMVEGPAGRRLIEGPEAEAGRKLSAQGAAYEEGLAASVGRVQPNAAERLQISRLMAAGKKKEAEALAKWIAGGGAARKGIQDRISEEQFAEGQREALGSLPEVSIPTPQKETLKVVQNILAKKAPEVSHETPGQPGKLHWSQEEPGVYTGRKRQYGEQYDYVVQREGGTYYVTVRNAEKPSKSQWQQIGTARRIADAKRIAEDHLAHGITAPPSGEKMPEPKKERIPAPTPSTPTDEQKKVAKEKSKQEKEGGAVRSQISEPAQNMEAKAAKDEKAKAPAPAAEKEKFDKDKEQFEAWREEYTKLVSKKYPGLTPEAAETIGTSIAADRASLGEDYVTVKDHQVAVSTFLERNGVQSGKPREEAIRALRMNVKLDKVLEQAKAESAKKPSTAEKAFKAIEKANEEINLARKNWTRAEIDDLARKKHGKDFSALTAAEKRGLGEEFPIHSTEISEKEVESLGIDSGYEKKWGEQFGLASDKSGKYASNGHWLIIDKKIAQEMRDKYWEKRLKSWIKGRQKLSSEADTPFAELESKGKKWVEQERKEYDTPNYEAVIPKKEGRELRYLGARISPNDTYAIFQDSHGVQVSVNAGYLRFLRKHFPDAKLTQEKSDDKSKPVQFRVNGELKALLMPMNYDSPLAPVSGEKYATRTPWTDRTAKATIHTGYNKMRSHEDYAAAKSGDTKAAYSLVRDLMNVEKIRALAMAYKGRNVVIYPVMAVEAAGHNKIPLAMADYISELTGWPVSGSVFQVNRTHHTGATAMERLMSQPEFEGEVTGELALIVDDVVTTGSIVAGLKGYIETRNVPVIGIHTMAQGTFGANLRISLDTLNKLKENYGDELPAVLETHYGEKVPPEGLTESEARTLNAHREEFIERSRERAVEAGHEAVAGRDEILPGEPAGQEPDVSYQTELPGIVDPLDGVKLKSKESAARKLEGGIKQAITDILENDDTWMDYGVRVIPKNQKTPKVGDVLNPSYEWIDGKRTRNKLQGTSTIGIKADSIERSLKDLHNPPFNEYWGDDIVLVRGERKGSGADAGETIIKNAEVVAIFKKTDLRILNEIIGIIERNPLPDSIAESQEAAHKAIRAAFPSAEIGPAELLQTERGPRWAFMLTMPNGTKVLVDWKSKIIINPVDYKAATGKDLRPGVVAAASWRQVGPHGILTYTDLSSPADTHHEAFHAAWDLVMTDGERKRLEEEFGSEEAAAEDYGNWAHEQAGKRERRERQTWLQNLYQRIRNFFQRLKEFFFPSFRTVYDKVSSGKIWERTARRDATEAGKTIFRDAADYAIRNFSGEKEVSVPAITDAIMASRPITKAMAQEFVRQARRAGVSEAGIRKAVEKFQQYNEIRKIGNFALLPKIEPSQVVIREGALNTPAVTGIRRERLDKILYPAIREGKASAETGRLIEGGVERTAIPETARGLEPQVFLNLPITQPDLSRPRPANLSYPLMVTGNPHLTNFKRPDPSWDSVIRAVRVKPVLNGSPEVTRAVAKAINYAREIGAHVLITTYRAKHPWSLARFTNFVPTDPKHPEFGDWWIENPRPRGEDPRTWMDWTPWVPRKPDAMAALFRANGWDTAKNLYGPSSYNVLTIVNSRKKGLQGFKTREEAEAYLSSLKDEKAFIEERGGTWWWPTSRQLDAAVLDLIEPGPIEYCDLFHDGCPSCRNCQHLTYPDAAGAPIVGVTDEPFCEMGCPQCFVRLGNSGTRGRKGISMAQNAKQKGFGKPDLGDYYPQTIQILQGVARPSGSGLVDVSASFLKKSPVEQVELATSLLVSGAIKPKEHVTIVDEVLRATSDGLLELDPPAKYATRKPAQAAGPLSGISLLKAWSRIKRGITFAPGKDVSIIQEYWHSPWFLSKKPGEEDIARLVRIELDRNKARTRATHEDLEAVKPVFDLKGKQLDLLIDLIWKLDGKQLQGVTAGRFAWGKNAEGRPGIRSLNQEHFDQMKAALAKTKYKDIAEVYVTLRKGLDRSLAKAFNAQSRMKDIEDSTIDKLRKSIGQIPNYFPHVRYGNWAIRGYDAEGKIVYRSHYYDTPKASARGQRILAKIKPQYPDAVRWDISPVTKLPDEMYDFPIPIEAMEQVIYAAAERVGDPAARALFEKAMPEAISDVIKSRGWGAHMIRRRDIPGHEKRDVKRILHEYFAGLNGWLTKMEASRKHSEVLRDLRAKKEPRRWKYASDYVRDALSNADRLDAAADTLRTLIYVKYLAGVIKSGVVNLTQNVVAAVPRMSIDAHWAGTKYLGAAQKAIVGAVTKGQRLSENELKVITDLVLDGVASDQFNQEIKGRIGTRIGNTLNQAVDILGLTMALPERFNRISTGLAAYRLARDGKIINPDTLKRYGMEKGKGWPYEKAKAYAEEIINDTHFVMGKSNLPTWARGPSAGAKFGRAAYALQSFSHQYLQLLGWMAKQKRGYRAIFRSLVALMILGGIASLPFFGTVSRISRRMLGRDPESAARQLVPESTGANRNLWRDLVVYGVPSVLGVDISGSLSIEFHNPDNPVAALVGVPYSILVDDPSKAIEAYQYGDKSRAAEALAPRVVSNVLAGIRLYDEGAHTITGRPISQPGESEPRRISLGEAVAKSVGFQPLSSSKAWDVNEKIEDLTKFVSAKRSKWASRYANAQRDGNQKEMDAVRNEVEAWNARVITEGRPQLQVSLAGALRERARPRRPSKPMRGLANELKGLYE